MTPSRSAIAMSHLESGRLGDELEDVENLHALRLSLLGQRSLGPGAGGYEHVDAFELLCPGDTPPTDLGGQLRLFDAQVRARPGAVGPLRDVVDVDERQARDRPQDFTGGLPNPHPLVEP